MQWKVGCRRPCSRGEFVRDGVDGARSHHDELTEEDQFNKVRAETMARGRGRLR